MLILTNSDPSNIETLDQNPITAKNIIVDHDDEAKRPKFKRQAQDPNLDFFVFVGRWLKEKGADLIVGTTPSIHTFRLLVNLS